MNISIIASRYNEDIELIKTSLDTKKYISTILYGGYGRDEGSWYEGPDGRLHPYNDYDIVLVTSQPQPPEILKSLGDQLAEQIGIRWINLTQKTPEQLRVLTPTIFNYDLKYASKVIDGDKNILDSIPSMDPSNLPLKEGEELFFTRIWTLLGCLNDRGLEQSLADDESRFFRNQMAKAILAIVDVLLLQKKSYHPSYRERQTRLTTLFPKNDSMIQLNDWALKEKLQPKAPVMNNQELKELYNKVQTRFFLEMFSLLSKLYGTPITCARDLENHLKYHPKLLVGRIKTFLRNLNLSNENRIAVQIAQVYIATAYESGEINAPLLNRGIKLMRQVRSTVPRDLTWNQARVAVAKMRMEV